MKNKYNCLFIKYEILLIWIRIVVIDSIVVNFEIFFFLG